MKLTKEMETHIKDEIGLFYSQFDLCVAYFNQLEELVKELKSYASLSDFGRWQRLSHQADRSAQDALITLKNIMFSITELDELQGLVTWNNGEQSLTGEITVRESDSSEEYYQFIRNAYYISFFQRDSENGISNEYPLFKLSNVRDNDMKQLKALFEQIEPSKTSGKAERQLSDR